MHTHVQTHIRTDRDGQGSGSDTEEGIHVRMERQAWLVLMGYGLGKCKEEKLRVCCGEWVLKA